ncbi:MAG: hypothetical protein WC107_06980 [Patescibacteria group bacterium]
MISQKLPFRVYLGFEVAFDGKISVDSDYTSYEPEENKFTKRVLNIEFADQFKVFLSNHFKNVKDFTGLNLHILTEAPLGHGLGSNGALAAALAILTLENGNLEARFDLARKFLSASQKGYSSGISAYNALASTSQPILFFTNKRGYSVHPMSELTGKDENTWPIDFGLIYTGVQTNSQNVGLAMQHTLTELDGASHSISKLLNDYDHPPFQKTFMDMLNMTSSLMASGFVRIFTRGINDSALHYFFSTLNQYQNLLHILEMSTKTSDVIYRHIHEMANKEINGSGSGVKISGVGKGGVMLFAMPYGAHRKELIKLMEKLRQVSNPNIWLDYASWLDGIGAEEARLDQSVEDGKISSFLETDARILCLIHHGKRSKLVVTEEYFRNIARGVDIVLDRSTCKVLVAGNPLTSKALPSQKAAVAILSSLLDCEGFKLSNDQISDSYGTNRYDLQSKVVAPLIKQVKALTKRDLQLTISGSTYSDYHLSLDPSNISIAVSEKKI